MKFKQLLMAFTFAVIPLLIFATENYQATSKLNVRTGTSTKYKIAFTLKKGYQVEIIETIGDWSKVKYFEQTGYVMTKYLEPVYNNIERDDENLNGGISGLVLLAIIAFVYLFPFLMILGSNKTTSGEKAAWLLAVIFVSWFAWIFYMLLAPLKRIKYLFINDGC